MAWLFDAAVVVLDDVVDRCCSRGKILETEV
jgi:hypothetical protein